ncbi:unnamed protein product [Calypogeia fissa]
MEEREGAKKKRKRKNESVVSEKTLKKEAHEAAELESFLFGKLETVAASEFGHEMDDDDDDIFDKLLKKTKKEKKKKNNDNENEANNKDGSGDQDDDDDDLPGEGDLIVSNGAADSDREADDEEEARVAVVERDVEGEEKAPVWEDEEEARAVVRVSAVNRLRKLRKEEGEEFVSGKDYISRLRAQHTVLNRGVSWAELPSQEKERRKLDSELDSDSETERGDDYDDGGALEDQTLLENNDLVVKSRSRLPQGLIEMTRMGDGNRAEPSNGVVQSVEFHRNAQILMTAGFDKKLRFFQVDGKKNPKMQSIFLEDFPVHKAAFVPDGSKVVAAGRRNFYFLYHLEAGRVERISPLVGRTERSLESFQVSPDSKQIAFLGNEGYILLCSLGTKQLTGNLKMNGSVRAVSFAENGRHLVSTGGDGEIYHWDLRTRRCFHKGADEGCVKSVSLAVSPDSRLFATGSGSGVVNVYDREGFIGGVTRPIKSLMNLVTTVDNVKFNNDSQILAISSRMKKDALRLVHLPSYTVFSNWPTFKTPLHYVHSMDFSPGGGYLAVGNAAGKVLLYRVRHYDHA